MTKQPFLYRDGTSQAGRLQKALDPDYVLVDERTITDLLAFAREYARELRYFDEQNEEQGDWAGFLADTDLSLIASYLHDPENTKVDGSIKPHLLLFITFLELLQHARVQLNDLTRRHLEFYYREALRLTSQPGVPDHVHVWVELANGQDQFLLPAGSRFQAGQDSEGNARFYRSDEDLVANRASVASVKSLFVEKKVIGIREARLNPDILIEIFSDSTDVPEEGAQNYRAFMAMLAMALGTPGPGEKLQPYPDNRTINEALLAELDATLQAIPDGLYMTISTFRFLMQLKNDLLIVNGQEKLINQQWDQVNAILNNAGIQRDPQFQFDSSVPDNFEQNLLSALGRTEFGDFFNELPDVEDIYDLYRNCTPDREDVIGFIVSSLWMSVDDFLAMMKIVEDINGRWRQIYGILRAAGKKKYADDPNHVFETPALRAYEADKFNNLIQKTLGEIAAPAFQSCDDSYAEIIKLETYFHIPAEKFIFIRKINAAGEQAVQPWEWEQVYAILEDAHTEKIISDRRNALKSIMETDGFEAMIRFALGDPNPNDPLPNAIDFQQLDVVTDKTIIQEKLFLTLENFTYIKTNSGLSSDDAKWEIIYAILEQSQRRKRNWEVPKAEVEKWENVYVAEDARQVQVQVRVEGEADSPRWRTFGEGYHPPVTGKPSTVPGQIGFALASPLLTLAEGARTITLTLDFYETGFNAEVISKAIQVSAPAPFRFLLSTEKEMVTLAQDQVKIEMPAPSSPPTPGSEPTFPLKFTLTLNPQMPPIVPLKTGAGIQTPWPVIQIMLADIPGQEKAPTVKPYRAFQALQLAKIHLEVTVDGITNLVLQNDEGLLDAKTPFTPFGNSPVVGSSFYFAHSELCSKKLDELRLEIAWLAAPDNFATYYAGYPSSAITDQTAFKAQLRLYDNRSFFDITTVTLFDPGIVNFDDAALSSVPLSITPLRALDWRRYWQLELLDPDFQHSIYPKTAAENAKNSVIINPPYTPKIKRLSAGYTASLDLDIKDNRSDAGVDQLYHLEPFGYRNLTGDGVKSYPFLPQYAYEGELLIGIKDLVPPQNLSLLFQMAEGSADPDIEHEAIHWSFLSGDAWYSLDQGQLLDDTTHGLINSGILKFSLSPVEPSTLLPPDFYWIRAAIAKNSRSVADTIVLLTQAVRATFEDQNNAPDHLSQPLPAESIHALAESLPQVKAIHQPFSSFGGKRPEQARNFYIRVSERLRHKDRALTSWDYEHMVLEAFPGIYKVKCLPVGSSEDPSLSEVVQVVVIPDIRGKLPFDPFEPKASADVLWQIEQYLLKHGSLSAQLKVKNPTYVRIHVRLTVRFREGNNPGYYQDALNRELQQYLAPWAYDQSADIFFGGTINTSLIINFVEKRPYIDYVAGIKIFTSLDGKQFTLYEPDLTDTQMLFAPDAILVSDHSHDIDLITEEGFVEEFFTGINYWKIELDFQVG